MIRMNLKIRFTPVLPQLPEVLCQDLSNLWADMRNGVFNRSFRHRMRGYERLWNIPRYSPQWSPWLKANRKKPRVATTFLIAQLLQITSLHQTYINRCKDANRIGQCSIMTSIPGSKEPGIFCCLWHICQPPLSSIQWGQINRKAVPISEKHQFDVFHW